MVRIRIKLSRRSNWTAGIGLKRSIKRLFEYDLKKNLAQGRSNHISLQATYSQFTNSISFYEFNIFLWFKKLSICSINYEAISYDRFNMTD